ncbi:uncharacterized protein LOC143561732 [Bidens hawaiensis]|uniref:uncharacterized protein LOC143561732 n=1 Tax=Bidens hawaiensis TaxID=980011 RepID=UPI0040498D8F
MVQGDYTTQYGMIRDYVLELKKQIPCTTVKIQVEEGTNTNLPTRRFKRIYVCFGALKQGFKAIGRDLLGLDGAFMKGPFTGQILSVVGVDPNNGIYPVSFAVVETENLSSWTWFLENLGDDLDLGPNSCFTFMSDRKKGLLPAIENLFPCAEHRFCVRHIHDNFKATYRGKLYKDLLYKCAHATTIPEFETSMDELKAFNPDAHLWLSNIHPKHWSKSHFSGRTVSDMLINNMCEVFNGKIVEGRDMPIISALEYIREYLMRSIVNVLEVIDKSEGLLTPTATTELQNIRTNAAHYTVQWNGGDLYQVSGRPCKQRVVDLVKRTCTCRRWELTGIPCEHVVATIWNKALNGGRVGAVESWVNPVHRMDTWRQVYSFKINPINGRPLWPRSQMHTALTPPKHNKQVGRPKKARKRSAFELEDLTQGGKLSKKETKGACSKCGNTGHNIRTCKQAR